MLSAGAAGRPSGVGTVIGPECEDCRDNTQQQLRIG